MSYYAIETEYLKPTNHKGGRIKALIADNREWSKCSHLVQGYDHSLEPSANHRKAAQSLLERLKLAGYWSITGAGETRRGHVFTLEDRGRSTK